MSCADVMIDVQKQMAQNKNCNILSILCIWPRSSSRRLFIGSYTKSVGFCICYRPTNRGFSYCLVYVGRQRRSPTLVYAIGASGHIPRGTPCRLQDNYISTGIYRCSIPDHCMNFARIPDSQESARINAFHYVCIPPSSP